MGRSLRSGKQIKSLSPDKKRVAAGKVDAKPKAKAPVKKAPVKKAPVTKAPVKKAPVKKAAAATPSTKNAKASAPKASVKKPTSSNTRGSKTTTARATRGKKPQPKEESSESEEEEEEVAEEEDESESEEESGSESESESSDEVKKVAPAPLKKSTPLKKSKASPAKKKKEESSEEESSDESEDEVEKVAPAPLVKSSNKKEESSEDSEEEDEDGDEDSSGDEVKDKGFTDENADWLKPKQSKMKLMSSDEEEGDEDDDEFDAAAASSDDEEMLDVERQSRLIDAEMKLEQEEADMELQRTIAQQTSVFHLPTAEELEDDENRVVPPSELRARIEDILEVLAEFKARREPGRSRSEYIERLGQDMAELFGYLQELVDYFLSMLGPNECLEFLEASEKSRPLVVRVNTLKARRKDLAAALMKRGVRLDPLASWSKVGLKIYESTVPIGATPEYLAGHYMLQSAASMCPVMAMAPQPGDRVLDMSAAPGGKTSYISQLMRNKGVVIANDLKPERQKATVANLHRLGVRNVVTCCYDGRKIGSIFRNSFDRILLDAPCSGLGVISRDPSVKVQRTIYDVQRCAHLQKELLVAAIDALNHKSKKGGGYMVYSTCSVAVAENEEVINYLLSKRDVKLVDTGLDFGKPGFTRFEHKRFHPSVALTRRFYPHVHNMDGFYVAKIQKLSDKRKGEEDKKQDEKATDDVKDDTMKVAAGGDEKKVDAGSNNKPSTKKKMQKRKKRRPASKDGDEQKIPQKKSKISYPDVQAQKLQKNKTNAKISKPRRMKVTGM
mmetsp:Transcript_3393/g.7487  ORF Transcript_3393/g.7487 Transcript_3393/m.7487 type:complete len:785 (-) Transcript_3393:133-2487(-)|eukprot:CAMPEP_0172298760 /NCGR_PEP_ID=MMETSP1058-20130122/1266_1 /TAXON_ID=83371 /ORGANISM="Detonula confervacea, Strain CCMP 353" /LENGTH=784 /DNA_ID=CAMNT_0013008049 /DNA_START=113 /DNA_END=2467 /DNA_ORIENTATION=-